MDEVRRLVAGVIEHGAKLVDRLRRLMQDHLSGGGVIVAATHGPLGLADAGLQGRAVYDALVAGKGEFINGSRLVYQMEKTLNENREKVGAVAGEVDAAIADAKKAVEEGGVERMNDAFNAFEVLQRIERA